MQLDLKPLGAAFFATLLGTLFSCSSAANPQEDGENLAYVLVEYGNCIARHDELKYRMRVNPTRYAGFTDEVSLSKELEDNVQLAEEVVNRCAAKVDLSLSIDQHIASNPLSQQDIEDIATLFGLCIGQKAGASETGLEAADLKTLDDIHAVESVEGVEPDAVYECRVSALYGEWQSFPQ